MHIAGGSRVLEWIYIKSRDVYIGRPRLKLSNAGLKVNKIIA